MAEEALTYATRAGVPLYLNRYIARAVGNDEYVADLEAVYNDDRFAGFDLYEWVSLARSNPDGTQLKPVDDGIERIRTKAHDLGLI